MNKQQAHEIKLQASLYAESCAMLALHRGKATMAEEVAIAKCAEERNKLFSMLDNLTEKEE